MALQVEIPDPKGINAFHWVIGQINSSFLEQKMTVTVLAYASEERYDAAPREGILQRRQATIEGDLFISEMDKVNKGEKSLYQVAVDAAKALETDDGTPFFEGATDTGPAYVPAWREGVDYEIGDRVSHSGEVYECIQAHTSQAGWEPPNVPALFEQIT